MHRRRRHCWTRCSRLLRPCWTESDPGAVWFLSLQRLEVTAGSMVKPAESEVVLTTTAAPASLLFLSDVHEEEAPPLSVVQSGSTQTPAGPSGSNL